MPWSTADRGVGNFGAVDTDIPWAGRPASAEVTLPPPPGQAEALARLRAREDTRARIPGTRRSRARSRAAEAGLVEQPRERRRAADARNSTPRSRRSRAGGW
jgi:hypothetical protein